jgi:acetylornithine deacetylase/succinyl-diaminopimelate desuccinylase-like protein
VSDEAILASAAKDVDRSLELYRELLQVPSVWGDARELSRAADLLAGALRDAGCDVSLKDSGTPGMPMLQARLRGRRDGPALLLAGHMEVYPPSESWTLDPWAATVRDGRVYGQGAADMKGGTAGMCAAAAVLGRAGVDLPGDLIVLAVPNHFEGGEGTRKAVREGLHADAAIVCEPTDLLVVTGQRGILYLEITVRGRAAHTTALRIGVNAIERASRIALALHAMGESDSDGEPVGAAPIVNVAMVQGGLVHNIVPERCVLTVDIRFAPEQTAEDVLRDVRAAVAAAVPDEPDLPTSVEPEHTCVRNPRSSLRLAGDHPLAQWMSEVHATATGRPATPGFHPAWPDTPILNEAGIPALTYGPGSMECYWDDEFVAIEDYLAAVRSYCLAAARGCEAAVPR